MAVLCRCIVVLFFATGWLNLAGAAPAFPVQYSADGRYLVDQNGVPFPIMGRTAWFLTSLSATDQHTFVDDTAMRGYSTIEFHVINHDPRGNHPPFNGNGNAPFLNRLNGTSWNGSLSYGDIDSEAPDFTTPNQAFWNSVDALLSYCETNGILVLMFPAYVGWMGGEQGWMREIVANGPTKMQSYGSWIADRYRNQKNLVWMMGGDMGTPPNTFNAAQTAAEAGLLTGLQSVAGQQSTFFTAEWNTDSIATDQTDFGAAMTLNGAYSHGGDVNTQGRRAYTHTPVEPSFLLEGPYDQEGPDGNNWNPSATQPVRRFQWWSWLSTIGGYVLGNGYVWPFNSPDWQNHLDTPCTHDMTRLNSFMGSVAWYRLVPSGLNGMRTLITAGNSSVSSSSYVAASATFDGTLLIAYVPPDHSGSITVDMAAMSAPSHGRWFDPTNAAFIEIGTNLPNTGTRVFNPPGNNGGGEDDWVLILQTPVGSPTPSPTATPSPTPTPPTTPTPSSTPTGTATPTVAPTPTSTPSVSPSPTVAPTPTTTPSVSPTPSPATPTPTPTATQGPAQALNLSTRMYVQTNDNVGVGGFVISGIESKHLLIRVIGPSLGQAGTPNALADPILELHGGGTFVTVTNDNWRDDPIQEAAILADGIPPGNDFESAIDANLPSGAYTAVVRGKDGLPGVALIEVYDLSAGVLSRLLNISTRAFVSVDSGVVIAGFILGNEGGDARIVVRGIGPSLAGIPNALVDPTLELRDSNGALLTSDDNWQDDPSQAAELITAGLAPTNNLESGIAATLPPGLYTALLAGQGNGIGVGLIEVYDRASGP